MAIIKRGILGGFSNKIGNVVGTSWKGISVMRSLPQSVHNPRTVLQTRQRRKFATVSAIGSSILDLIIKPYWDPIAIRMSGYNKFVSETLKAQEENIHLVMQDVNLLHGCSLSFAPIQFIPNEDDTWDFNANVVTCGSFTEEGATLHMAVINERGKMLAYGNNPWDDGISVTVSCTDNNSGHLWTAFAWGTNESTGETTSSVAKTFDIA